MTLDAGATTPQRPMSALAGSRPALWLYRAHRVLQKLSGGRAGLQVYLFCAQPVDSPTLRSVREDPLTRIVPVMKGSGLLPLFPRPLAKLSQRFASGATCFAVLVKDEFAGHIWLARTQYDEDEVRCRYVLPNAATGWDFDVYVAPPFRATRVIARLWKGVSQAMEANGINWSYSRISIFNAASVQAHERMGAEHLCSGAFLTLGSVQVAILSKPWRLHVTMPGAPPPVLQLPLPKQAAVAGGGPSPVVLGLDSRGLGVARAVADAGVAGHALEKNSTLPEVRSNRVSLVFPKSRTDCDHTMMKSQGLSSAPAPCVLVALGEPRFADESIGQSVRRNGAAAAWLTLLRQERADSALARVQGSFAIAWRAQNGGVHLAVDRFAIQSLCYRVIGGQLHFAERAEQLAELAPRAELAPQALFDYLYFHVIPSPRTIFEGVCRVPPGHRVRLVNGQAESTPYWVPKFEPSKAANFKNLANEFRGLVKTAVQRQLDGSKPACFLSGGTDSSTVAGMIGLVTGQAAATYSIGFEAEGYDEMAFARLAAKRFGTEHHEYYVTPDDLVQSIPLVAGHYDQPFGNSSVLPAYYCAKMAKADGVTRLLAGDGGDEFFGGNARYATQRIFGWYDALPGLLRGGLLEPLLERTPAGRLPLLRKGASYVGQAKVPLPDRMQVYNLLLRLGVNEVLEPDFLARVQTDDPLRQQRAIWAAAPQASPLNRMLAYDWRYTLAEADLPKVCGSTALAGISVGFPFLDADLVDFSLRLPDEYKLRRLKLRWFFKEALRGFLPDEILTKKKQGFGLPFGVWMTRHAGLRALAEDSLHGLAGRGIVRAAFIKKLLHELVPAHPGYYGEMVWILMMLEQWLRARAPHSWAYRP